MRRKSYCRLQVWIFACEGLFPLTQQSMLDRTYALTANTIPLPQCPTWLQYAQMGLVSRTAIVNTGIEVALAATGMNPDLKPVTFDMTVLIGAHGELKAD